MNGKITLRLVLLLIFSLPALSLFGQSRYQEGNGIFITNGIGGEFTIPVSIRVFGDNRFVVGPGVKLGQTNVHSFQAGPDSFQRTETVFQFGLMALGFNF